MSLLLQPDERERYIQRGGAGGDAAVRVGTPQRSLHHGLGPAYASDSEPGTGSVPACRRFCPAAPPGGRSLGRLSVPCSDCAGGGVVKLERHAWRTCKHAAPPPRQGPLVQRLENGNERLDPRLVGA